MVNIEQANIHHAPKLVEIYLEAFDSSEAELVAELAIHLNKVQGKDQVLSLIATESGRLIGHVAFSPVQLQQACIGAILAPLAVMPDHQKKGVGSLLVNKGLEILKDKNESLVFVYGDPSYYGRFGFKEDIAKGYLTPHPLQYPFGWQALKLNKTELETGEIRCVEALNKAELW